ncbi:hypothetical protein MJO28_008380 [Puccinia striiformis f. sp. tritici]|nr:hypothetical protein Pst134EA_015537 [Puccinia striiformis f. sp. tritici]KAI9602719.1 hypothetical protein H4Q26_002015 [Puccinia striiformis f. sp. tritici PST-130]KNE99039.1 hypothetical protein PSTG_07692 [Puccinia striiformis f. sp. tritici PST-78]KAH9452698.1 hypothetical protein Pst134EB_016652 [Puccinia striiformis f. sp. tritici]KAH9463453.1 hypothetical protein Pst134EA_015537 [Puccinia striiformis f. sp. tritici]KAI7949559.1 hypothetical protein MJO28_008380 [Puccinia striiformis
MQRTTVNQQNNKPSKTDQLIHRIYCKSTQLIIQARTELKPATRTTEQNRIDKWFNIELPDPEYFKEELKTWKAISASGNNPNPSGSNSLLPIPVLIFETILDTQALPPNSFITLTDSQAREHSIDHRIHQPNHPNNLHHQPVEPNRPQIHKNIVIERWSVSLLGPIPPHASSLEPPTVYRHCIIHFRALYSHLRTLPASSLFQRLKKRTYPEHGILKIGCRISTTSPYLLDNQPNPTDYPRDEIGIYQDLSNSQTHARDSISTYEYPSIQTPLGSIKTRVTYRNQIEFRIGDRERMLSSRFRHEDRLERPLKATSTSDNQGAGWMFNYRAACSKFTKAGLSVPNPTTNDHPTTRPHPQHSPKTDHQPNSVSPSPNLRPELYPSENRPPLSYGSLSSRHHSTYKPLKSNLSDGLFTPVEPPATYSDSLSADILAATESSPFASAATRSSQSGNGNGNSSALTAKLAAHRQSLPPVLSNALPIPPSSLNRSNSTSTTAGAGGSSKMGASNTGASSRQFSVLSSSPLSGPSSSIRISSGRANSYQATSSVATHLFPGMSPTTTGVSSGSSYSPIHNAPLSPIPIDPSSSTQQRVMIPGQPMVRRYSSSRHSRSFGQASSSGGASLITADSAGSLSRRALLNSSSGGFDELLILNHRKSLSFEDKHRNDINSFLKLIDSSQTIPHDPNPNPSQPPPSPSQQDQQQQASRPAHHSRYQRRTRESVNNKNEEIIEGDVSVDHPATTIEEEEEDDDDDENLSRLMKEKVDLTLKKLAGSVAIPFDPPSTSSVSIPSSTGSLNRPTPSSTEPNNNTYPMPNSSQNYRDLSGTSSHHGSVNRKGKGRLSDGHSSPGRLVTNLQGLVEEEDEAEDDDQIRQTTGLFIASPTLQEQQQLPSSISLDHHHRSSAIRNPELSPDENVNVGKDQLPSHLPDLLHLRRQDGERDVEDHHPEGDGMDLIRIEF